MSDSQMKHIGQVQPGEEPAKYEIGARDQQAFQRAEVRRREIHAGQSVQENDQITNDTVYFQDAPPWRYTNCIE
jgi:hypothetical protein